MLAMDGLLPSTHVNVVWMASHILRTGVTDGHLAMDGYSCFGHPWSD